MFDHVGIRVSDLEEARRFYETGVGALGFGEPTRGEHFFEWEDLSVGAAREDRPVTSRLHVGLVAPSREHVDEFWRALTAAGFRDDGAPGLRPQYSEDYYGAFVLDPDGNSIEALHHGRLRTDGLLVQHLWLRVRDVQASKRFYETIAPVVGFELATGSAEWAHFRDRHASFTVTSPDADWSVARPLTENVHVAFSASDNATVEEFHRVALAAGYEDNGAPGERARYHPGYYGAFVLDPDGNNVEAVCHNR
jgi:catechol 2,3-dioxygenase-like lactoylglutathione lyase family enzyme